MPNTKMTRDRWMGVLMITPSIVLLGIFVYGFIAQTVYASLTDWRGLDISRSPNFIGLENFNELFNSLLDSRFRGDIVNTIFFTVLFIAGCLILGLGMAILLDQKIKGEAIFRTIFLFPMALSFVVTGTVWRWLFNPNSGLNKLPELFGGQKGTFFWHISNDRILQFEWLDLPLYLGLVAGLITLVVVFSAINNKAARTAIMAIVIGGSLTGFFLAWRFGTPLDSPVVGEKHGFNLALIAIVIAATWQLSGYTMAMYLAGLRGIPEELREAARVDGCNEIGVYRRVVFPLLQPITLSAVIILGHISLKIFDLVFVIAGESNLKVDVPGVNMYITAFRGNYFGKGAAMGVIMLIMVAAVIIPYLISNFRQEAGK
jgi:glucose/mannose transport system permease protein